MTVNEAITRSAISYPADADKAELCAWLNEIEGRICAELHGKEPVTSTEESADTVLCAPDAYAELYPLYLIMKRELICGDDDRYAFFAQRFEQAYARYAKYTVRSAVPSSATYIKTV